ncbi:hypothetical protein M9H77_10260 [Catharanthus roseus]|uniref:Uncharacterized protein n=1 Tax=Catharanthus roseus TaxID=4058 RepID=A0ACC0C2Y9_CATRO|nr:hypothetical protein M9H77_10260 [Catharanthus roseus]
MELKHIGLLFLACSGLFSLTQFALSTIKWLWCTFFRLPKTLKEYGSWALITGATDGIGKALAFELASRGINVVLVGRNPSKLEDVCNDIKRIHGDNVVLKSVVLDFAKSSGEEIAEAIKQAVKGLDIGILINNVGLAYPYAKFFHEVDTEMVENLLKVNIEAMTWVTSSVLPGMLEKKKGAIINIGSGSSELSSYPLYTVYAACKAFVAMFSKCISLEYKQHGIDIQCQARPLKF